MRLSESHTLPLRQADAWAALNDLAVLQHALPGCESLVEIARDEFVGEMAVPLGLTTSRFTIHVHRRDIDAPHGCTLHFETRTGGGSGTATLRLAPHGDAATTLQVGVAVATGGGIGQFAGPLLDLAAHQMAALFFERFRAGAVARQAGMPMA